MPKVFIIQGSSGSGKTMLIQNLTKRYYQKGKKVGIVKSYAHHLAIDGNTSKDSSKFREAGAQMVLMQQQNQHTLFSYCQELSLKDLVAQFFSACDIVFAEGFSNDVSFPRLIVLRSSVPMKPLVDSHNLLAFIQDEEALPPLPSFPSYSILDTESIVSFLDQHSSIDAFCQLRINGKNIPMNRFVEKVLAGTLLGLLDTIKCEDDTIQSVQLYLSNQNKEDQF